MSYAKRTTAIGSIASLTGATLVLLGCGGSSSTAVVDGVDAADESTTELDAAADMANPAETQDARNDGEPWPAGFFVSGDIDGTVRLGVLAATPFAAGAEVVMHALEEDRDAAGAGEWYLSLVLPIPPFPVTIPCTGTTGSGVYQVAFLASPASVTTRATGICSFTFVEPSVAGSFEGTFTAVLRDNTVNANHPLMNGRFRIPRTP